MNDKEIVEYIIIHMFSFVNMKSNNMNRIVNSHLFVTLNKIKKLKTLNVDNYDY